MRSVKVYENSKKEKLLTRGKFHQWANTSKWTSEGVANYTSAIVELEDGTVIEADIEQVRFEKEKRDNKHE